jgi:hypothetical protein
MSKIEAVKSLALATAKCEARIARYDEMIAIEKDEKFKDILKKSKDFSLECLALYNKNMEAIK